MGETALFKLDDLKNLQAMEEAHKLLQPFRDSIKACFSSCAGGHFPCAKRRCRRKSTGCAETSGTHLLDIDGILEFFSIAPQVFVSTLKSQKGPGLEWKQWSTRGSPAINGVYFGELDQRQQPVGFGLYVERSWPMYSA
eukprot:Selendium_serpulae@DN5795_c0_g1_i3.p1